MLAVHLPSATLAQDGIGHRLHARAGPCRLLASRQKGCGQLRLFVEEFGFGQGPVFRPDLATRNPDLVNEAFRQYGIDRGIMRVGRLFKELDVPLSVVVERGISRRLPVGVEGVPGGAAELRRSSPMA